MVADGTLIPGNLRLSETSVNQSTKDFCRLMKQEFGEQYLNWRPSQEELRRCLAINAVREHPGLFSSWDCKHFDWKNCPVALAGQLDPTGNGLCSGS